MEKKSIIVLVLLLLVAGLSVGQPASAASVAPIFVDGNPTCFELGYLYEFKIDPPTSGQYPVPGVGTVTFSNDGIYVNWSSSFGVDAVIVKGGSNANLYAYSPEETGDSGLHSPINPNNETPYGVSHVTFCYDFEVNVVKTAETSYDRTYSWDIAKTADQTALTLSPGQIFPVNYEVTVSTTGFTDSNWAVSGLITVSNPDPSFPALLTGVSDSLSGIGSVAVSCPVAFPYSLPAGGSIQCSYSKALPDASSRTNTATASVDASSKVGGSSGSANVIFGQPSNEIDECVEVTDSLLGSLGTACAGQSPKVFSYTFNVGPYAVCGEYRVLNTAAFVTNDAGSTGSDDHTVNVSVPCGVCTLTQGYWKTHSSFGPASYDDAWSAIGENSVFFNSGLSYYQVLWTPPAGKAYFNLAHQYIAAKLNILNGASAPAEVSSAITFAESFFSVYTQNSTLTNPVRAQALYNANILDQFNNGLIGPGHCSE